MATPQRARKQTDRKEPENLADLAKAPIESVESQLGVSVGRAL